MSNLESMFLGNYDRYQGSTHRHLGLPPPAAHVLDPRLVLTETLRPDVFRGRHVLDVGCNNGQVTVQLASSFGAASVTGIEVDPNLIRRARDHLSFHASRSRPSLAPDFPALSSAAAAAAARDTLLYFPISSVLDHGHRLPPDARAYQQLQLRHDDDDGSSSSSNGGGEVLGFPDNVEFRVDDWAQDIPVAGTDEGQDAPPPHQGPYDTILALSVIKWIHLSQLDAGLERFLSRCCGTSLRPEGYLVIELQPWSSYRAAVTKPHKAPHLAGNLAKLRLGPDDLGRLLLERGLVQVARSDALPRSVYVYRKVAADSSAS